MKHIAQFSDFLDEVVNLNSTRIDQLDSSVEAIKRFIRDSTWAPKLVEFAAHGSWAHQTIIKPVEGNAFDADLVAYVEPVEGWESKQYVNELAAVFRSSNLYKDKLRVYSHCVTIEYAGQRKIDIAPCVVNRQGGESLEVCNRMTNEFQASNPKGYTDWIKERNRLVGNHSLRKVTRLLKYIRDIKCNFTCPSFLLTTLIGLQIKDSDSTGTEFADIPMALKTVVGRLDEWLAARLPIPQVSNPVLRLENQSANWSETQYKNFCEKIHLYRIWIDDAYSEGDKGKSIQKWQAVFGDEFGTVRESARKSIFTQVVEASDVVSVALDHVDLVRKFGPSVIGADIARPAHLRPPEWPSAASIVEIHVTADLAFATNRMKRRALASAEPLLPGHWVEFSARLANGASIGSGYRTEWRVTNNGPVAASKSQLRGGFYASENGHTRQERLQYRGVHLVEAFVIRQIDNVLVGQSQPFFVVIE